MFERLIEDGAVKWIVDKLLVKGKLVAGSIEGTPIGAVTPAAGAFTTLSSSINAETLAATKTLVTTDYIAQWLDPDGADRDVVLPVEASSTNLLFIILNTADGAGEDLVVKNAAAATKATLGPGMMGMFSCDGTNWKWENDTGVFYDSVNDNVGIGTTGPGAKLDVNGNILISGAAPSLTIGARLGNQVASLDFLGTNVNYVNWEVSSNMQVNNALTFVPSTASGGNTFTTPVMTILNTGNVGIGTTVPSVKLAIGDADCGFDLIAADSLATIVGGVEGHRITETAGAINHILIGIVKTPTTQVLTGAGAVDIVSAITHLVTAGVGDALTLANGAEGQVKTILTKTETTAGDTSVLTPTSFANGATITFDAPGDIAQLLFSNGAWHYTGGVGCVIG